MVCRSLTHKHVFDYQDGDVYACVADIGWITGHSYILYGPLVRQFGLGYGLGFCG